MKKTVLIFFIIGFLFQHILAQHCEPIINNYFNKIELSKTGYSGTEINLSLTFYRQGGPIKDAHQIYIFLLKKSNEAKLLSFQHIQEANHRKNMKDQDSLFEKIKPFTHLIYTGKIENNKENKSPKEYPFKLKMTREELFSIMKTLEADEQDLTEIHFKFYAVIPFLDSPYSNIQGLPSNTHDCNTAYYSYLAATVLPFKIYFSHFSWIKEPVLRIEND